MILNHPLIARLQDPVPLSTADIEAETRAFTKPIILIVRVSQEAAPLSM